ncbi:MAG: hypothetical protein IPM82_07735 [Saprospiraceae bacterium]|nr:hypothetical protein [Saprospiraceae bacterium]
MKNLIISGTIGAVIFTLLMVKYPDLMLSPGELVEGHQDLSRQCFSCHQAFGGIENDKCIACHTLSEIGKDTLGIINGVVTLSDKVLFHKNLDKYACTTCHTDHAGLNPVASMNGFEHDVLPKMVINDCIGCHQKPEDTLHQQLTNACAKCHSTNAWELELAFNHDMVQPADRDNCVGCHQKPDDKLHQLLTEACAKCHVTTDWELEVAFNHDMVQPADRDNCIGCHENPTDAFHRTLKDNCSKCHGTNKWVPSTFDHSAYFVLDSDHNVKCATCHLNNNYIKYTCYGCHEHTVGNIQHEHREEGIANLNDCVACHKSSNEDEAKEGRRKNNGGGDDDGDD